MVHEPAHKMSGQRRILLGVTATVSLRFLEPLPRMLNEVGFDVHVVSNPGHKPHANSREDFQFHEISMAREPAIIKDLYALHLWFRLIRKIKPTIVAIGTPKASLLGLFVAWMLRVPSRVYVLRGLRLETTKGLLSWLLRHIEKFTAGRATHVLAVSKSLAAKYVELGLCASDKITVLGSGSSHGVDLDRFQPSSTKVIDAKKRELGLAPGVPVIGFVGRFSKDKGAQALLATRKTLLASDVDHETLIVGPVEDSQTVLNVMNRDGRPIKLVGEISNVEDYYPLMTILMLPTRREGFPNVVLEAGATAVPAVARSVTGAIDSILDGETGVLVGGSSDQDYAERVRDLLTDPGRCLALGKAARKRIEKEFEQTHVCEKYVAFLMNIH